MLDPRREVGERSPRRDRLVHAHGGQLVEHDAAWTGYFTGLGIQPLSITYEELAAAHEPVVRDVLAYLGIDAPPDLAERIDQPRLEVQADATSEEWVRRYRSERVTVA